MDWTLTNNTNLDTVAACPGQGKLRVKKIKLSEYAEREGISYHTALRRRKAGQIVEPVQKTPTGRYYVVIDETPQGDTK